MTARGTHFHVKTVIGLRALRAAMHVIAIGYENQAAGYQRLTMSSGAATTLENSLRSRASTGAKSLRSPISFRTTPKRNVLRMSRTPWAAD